MLLTDAQVSAILNILIHQGDLIAQRNRCNQEDFPELYDKDYLKNRGHNDTGAVYSGFRGDIIPEMQIQKHKYRSYIQPELHSTNAVIQLYNIDAGRPLTTKEYLEKCAQCNIPGSEKLYAIIRF